MPTRLVKRFDRKNQSIVKKVETPYVKYSVSKAMEKKALKGFK